MFREKAMDFKLRFSKTLLMHSAPAFLVRLLLGVLLGIALVKFVMPAVMIVSLVQEKPNPLGIAEVRFEEVNDTHTLIRVKLFNNSSRILSAYVVLEEPGGFYTRVKRDLGPFEVKEVVLSAKARARNITIPYTGEVKTVVAKPRSYAIYAYPEVAGFTKARYVFISRSGSLPDTLTIDSVALKSMHTLDNRTVMGFSVGISNRGS